MKSAIVFFASDWGYKHGGINSMNRDITVAVSEVVGDSLDVVCIVLRANAADIEDARSSGVQLIPLQSTTSSRFEEHRADEIIRRVKSELGSEVAWWIGHDVITGNVATAVCAAASKGKCALFHHMNYDAYISYKVGNTSKSREKVESQRTLLSSADLVFAVGPKLKESALEKTRASSNTVFEIIPGLAQTLGLDNSGRFSAVTFGRLEANDQIKQARLATAAFGAARGVIGNPLGDDATLTVIGLSEDHQDEEHRALAKLSELHANRAVHVHGWPYLDDRQRLLNHLRNHSVCMMLSLHEGFGLTGWEAIAAEVPLILSENSGLYRLLDNLLGGSGLGCVQSVNIRGTLDADLINQEDLETTRDAIIKIRNRGV